MAKNKILTPEERAGIIQMRRENPQMRLRQIGEAFKVSVSCVCTTITKANAPATVAPSPGSMRMAPPPKQNQYISWTPDPKRLMAGK